MSPRRPKRDESSGAAEPVQTRRALILCGGGATGAAFEVGTLAALEDAFDGFKANDFDIYVGTSAGALVATLISGGVSTQRFYRSLVDTDDFFPLRRTDVYGFDSKVTLVKALKVAQVVAKAVVSGLTDPAGFMMSLDAADLSRTMPDGLFSLSAYKRFIEKFLQDNGLPDQFHGIAPELFIPANNLDTASREVFGRGYRLDASLPEAIVASSAIPLFFNPVRIGETDLVDGGSAKVGHVDLAVAAGATHILVINPVVPWNLQARRRRRREDSNLREVRRIRARGLWGVWNQSFRLSTHTRLQLELERFRAAHPDIELTLITPNVEDETLFVTNPMNTEARSRVAAHAHALVTSMLRTETGASLRRALGYP